MTDSFGSAFRGKRVILTGHTGFKGGWLALWLSQLGAEVFGYALPPPTNPSFFDVCDLSAIVDHHVADIRDPAAVRERVEAVRPDIVFHLAAQPLVRYSYAEPIETIETNFMGTAHLMEAVRAMGRPCSVVIVTSDKCYANTNRLWGYRENERMGGEDPYSMSKGVTELLVDSWRSSFFSGKESQVRIASGRAGNVIGGGDWAMDRIVTDCIAALRANKAIVLRNPVASRPWQHVLEPLSGYLWLAKRLMDEDGQRFTEGWNFGPKIEDICTVETLAEKLISEWGKGSWVRDPGASALKEAMSLSLNCEQAYHRLGWSPTWSLDESISQTAKWYRAWYDGAEDMRELSKKQINHYQHDAVNAHIAWALPS